MKTWPTHIWKILCSRDGFRWNSERKEKSLIRVFAFRSLIRDFFFSSNWKKKIKKMLQSAAGSFGGKSCSQSVGRAIIQRIHIEVINWVETSCKCHQFTQIRDRASGAFQSSRARNRKVARRRFTFTMNSWVLFTSFLIFIFRFTLDKRKPTTGWQLLFLARVLK